MTAPGQAILQISTDARRKAHADELLRAALGGSMTGLHQLFYEAYEKRTGAPGDMRTPRDGKYSPQDVRDLAVKALKRYAVAKGGIPEQFAQYAGKLGTVVIPSQKLVEAVKAVPTAPSIPPTPADDKRPSEAATAFQPFNAPQPILTQLSPASSSEGGGGGGGAFPPASYSPSPSPAAMDTVAPGGGGAVVDGQPVVGGDGSSTAASPLLIGIGVAALAAFFIFGKKGR